MWEFKKKLEAAGAKVELSKKKFKTRFYCKVILAIKFLY